MRSPSAELLRAVLLVTALCFGTGCERGCADAHTPDRDDVAQPARHAPQPTADQFGRQLSGEDARRIGAAEGAVKIDDELLALGEKAFYEETFGNEIFLTDVVGILSGPMTAPAIAKAIAALKGNATSNLRVELAADARIADRTFRKGQTIDTGLDVAAGSVMPLGMKIELSPAGVRSGMTCAACHSTVDSRTGKVVHGAPNSDLQAGLMIALATNSAAYFSHTDADPRSIAPSTNPARSVTTASGKRLRLPDVAAMEAAADAVLVRWPPGSFDSMTDLQAAPAQLPTSFTWRAHPYSFSGAFMAGPFRGLSAQNNNVHGLNADTTVEADQIETRLGIDRELFLAVILQNAPAERFRWQPGSGVAPSAFLNGADPTPGQPGLNEMIALPTYPRASLAALTGLWTSDPGHAVWEKVNAMSAWQNTLRPPHPLLRSSAERMALGRKVFDRAGCAGCHSGPALTNNRILPATAIGTQPLRARALSSTERVWADPPIGIAFDVDMPPQGEPRELEFPMQGIDPEQMQLAYAHGGSPGGYKVPSLLGLAWSAPYLHDGGVAVGPDEAQLGVASTLGKGVLPDATSSLRALLDRQLRERVVTANRADRDLARMHVEGIGHELWVDAPAGFSADEQGALIEYLLAYQP